jgi:hypothetical protein
MKVFTYFFVLLILFTTNSLPQEKDSLIWLYTGLDDTVDSFDASYFELFPNIKGFEQAVFYIRNNQRLVSKVTYYENGKTRDTTFIQQLSALDDARKNIKEIEVENELKLETENETIVFLKDENTISGRLIMFNKDCIFIVTEDEDSSFTSKYLKIHLENIYQIKILGPSRTLSYGGLGAVVGVLLLPVNALVGAWALVTMWVFNPITCGVIGLVVGTISSRYEDIYIIETHYDILELKDDVKYYFKYDESFEEQYVEIE